MSDIFYSQVDPNLWSELNARGQAGRYDRSTKSMNFMLEKIANVMIIPYNTINGEPGTSVINEAILGGQTVRTGEYLPSGQYGFLTDRNYNVSEYGFNDQGNIIEKYSKPLINTSKRIPPYITSVDITIGDHSMGLLNSVTANFVIPNPERDLNYMESIYFRPGRKVAVIIEHPDSAVITMDRTNGFLSDTSLISAFEASDEYLEILKSNKDIQQRLKEADEARIRMLKRLQPFRHLNLVRFEGIIQSFTMDYQSDMSVQCTIQVIGTSNVYTDISLIINSNNANKDFETPEPGTTEAAAAISAAATGSVEVPFADFFGNLNNEVQLAIQNTKTRKQNKTEIPGIQDLTVAYKPTDITKGSLTKTWHWAIYGTPVNGVGDQIYIQTAWLVDYINRVIISKLNASIPKSKIIFQFPLCQSTYYNIVSADPFNVLFADNHSYIGSVEVTSTGTSAAEQVNKTIDDFYFKDNIQDYICLSVTAIRDSPAIDKSNPDRQLILDSFPFTEKSITLNTKPIPSLPGLLPITKRVFDPTSIFINLNLIKEIVAIFETKKSMPVSTLLEAISSKINSATGGAINLTLISHPDDPSALLWTDCNAIKTSITSNQVKPYSVPMFANHPSGTIVRDFKFSGRLPQDATNLSYVLNSDPSEIAESDIAPYVSFMYAANTVSRSGPHESISSVITEDDLKNIKDKYAAAHYKFYQKYLTAKTEYAFDWKNNNKRIALQNALSKYIQYPTDSISLSNELAAPVIPFDVEFTIDGINGFRYGDVLMFDGLPYRYRANVVFCVISVTHTVGTDGVWTTTVRCIMRPKIES